MAIGGLKRINTKVPIDILYEFKGTIMKKNVTYTNWLKSAMEDTLKNNSYLSTIELKNTGNQDTKRILAIVPEELSNELRGLLVAKGLRFDLWLIHKMVETIEQDKAEQIAKLKQVIQEQEKMENISSENMGGGGPNKGKGGVTPSVHFSPDDEDSPTAA